MQIHIQGILALLWQQLPIPVDLSPYVTLLAMLSEWDYSARVSTVNWLAGGENRLTRWAALHGQHIQLTLFAELPFLYSALVSVEMTRRGDGAYSLSINPGMSALPPTTKILARKAG